MASSKATISVLCCLCFLCLSSPAIAGYDFFYFSLLWPGTYCRGSTCCLPTTGKPALDFFVNGLKPYDSTTGKPVTNCNSACKFYVNSVYSLIGNLYLYWSDVSCPSNNGKDQWAYTWCKYGNCTSFTEEAYFQRALNLRKKISLLSLLDQYDITPSNDALYKLSDIQESILGGLGAQPFIECKKRGWSRNPAEMLRFTFCVDSSGERLIMCPGGSSSNCPEKVKFPRFTYDMLRGDDCYGANRIELPSAKIEAM